MITQEQYAFVHRLILEYAELPETDKTVDSLRKLTTAQM